MVTPDAYPYTVLKKIERRHLQKLRTGIFFHAFLSVVVFAFYLLWLASYWFFQSERELMFALNLGFGGVWWGLVGLTWFTPFNWIFPWVRLLSARREYAEYKAYYDL